MKSLRKLLALPDHETFWIRVAARGACAVSGGALAFWIPSWLVAVTGATYLSSSFPIVLAVGLAAGTAAGLSAVALLTFGYAYVFMFPDGVLDAADRAQALRLAGYAISSGLVAIAAGALRAAYRRSARLRREAETAAEGLRRLQQARDDLLRALSHDVRTPLSTIVNNAEILRRGPDAGTEVVRRADTIGTSARRIVAMVADLVEAFRFESGQIALRRRTVDLGVFLGELTRRLEGTLPVERVRLAISPAARAVDADPDRLERIVVNLLSNALKYSAPDAPVVVGTEASGAEVVITVADRGPGIRAEEVPHIFERFYRGSGAGSTEGLGLGLYITRLLAEAHGGRVAVETSPSGSTFRVVLPPPAHTAPEPEPPGVAPAPEPH